ncbi:MAG: HypC/HybG/HupF family hydrogenase formation chaperone [Cyclobacteriaceae bacterium]
MCLAIPGKIIEVDEQADPAFRMGKVSFEGIVRSVNLSMVPEARKDDYVLVHVGVALNTIDEKEANQVFTYLKQIGEVDDELGLNQNSE